ncbi:hypothetical protein TOPH_06084 [Tolypocladium ophioglossoides CBS 100239]|uniref:Uncharacterized protein n=1 Tax=Tolypocladium ophioglossoides (strain CBS 100239) TaxID=1163406 RepID=A0A0L0N5I1_TOLOC|nr:hypothetical protein TOPH_06084 [Tolypocladium ophioglossoides CBS 100239]
MSPIRHGNVERRRRRDECRVKLAQHINNRLGIKLNPSDVRLTPRATDLYSWQPVRGKEELFSTMFSKIFAKGLSDHSVGTFQLLCSEVGESFEAVLPRGKGPAQESIMPLSPLEPSFSAIIDQLQEEKMSPFNQIEELTRKANTECEQRQAAERKVHQLYNEQADLKKQLQVQADMSTLLREVVAKCVAELNTAISVQEGPKEQRIE